MKDINVLALAYIGDAIYEVHIRNFLINSGIVKVKELQEKAICYVSAKAQANILEELINSNFFNEKELDIIYRARNHKGNRHPKNTDILTYKHATAFEAVIGYLYYVNSSKIDSIIKIVISKSDWRGVR